MSELLRFFKDMRDNGYGLAEIAAQLGTSAIAEPVAGFAAMYDPTHGADAIREGMTYQPRSDAAKMYQRGAANAIGQAVKPVMPIIDTWKQGVDIAGRYSPVVGAGLRTVPAAIGIAMGAKPALQAGRQVSEGLGVMQGRMIANANAPRTLNTGYMGQRGAINPSDFNLVTNPDGTVTMYHGTTKDAAKKIIQERKLLSAGEPDVYMTTDPMAGYGDGTTVKFNIDPKHINLDDEFPSGRVDFRMPAAKGWRIQNPEINTPKRPLTEFEQAHLTAQRNAALPVNQGGLGLAPDNTAMDRARAMGFDVDNPVYHGSGADIDAFDPKLLKETSQYMKGVFTTDKPDIASNYGDTVYPLVQKQGYTLKDKRTDRASGKTPKEVDTIRDKDKNIIVTTKPENIRSRFAAFDPFNRESSNLLATTAPLVPTTALGAYMYNENRKKSQGNQ